MKNENIYHDNIPGDAGISVHTGFPNPAIDASLKDLDLNQLLISHSAATYFMQIDGDSWQPLGIFNNDLVVIDRAITAYANDLVVWWHEDAFMISHLHQVPTGAVIWGVVTATIHRFKQENK
jgi:DNA polymerase V